jgi:LPS-assembly lipoprotein
MKITINDTLPKNAGRISACATMTARLVFLLPLALCGCGFHPVYASHDDAPDSTVAMDLNNIVIENIPDRNGQILRNDLIDRMYGHNRPEKPLYHLVTKVHYSEEDLGILANATATRELLNMYSDYSLQNAQGQSLLNGTAHSVASFDRLDQMYGTVAARQDAYERTLHEVSEQIVNRLSLYFSERK